MKVVWTETAISQLAEIYDYISRDSAKYAKRMVDRLTASTGQLSTFPNSGGNVTEYRNDCIREIIEGPYRIIYRVDPSSVVVLTVLHGARLLPDNLPRT